MSLEKNLDDLERHARDFETDKGFTYPVLDGDDVIGCLYIYPSSEPGHGADVLSWVTADRAEIDAVLPRSVAEWLAADWPFDNPDYALDRGTPADPWSYLSAATRGLRPTNPTGQLGDGTEAHPRHQESRHRGQTKLTDDQ